MLRLTTWLILAALMLTLATPVARAGPTQAEVFKSIQNGVGHDDQMTGKTMAAIVAGAVAVVLLAVVYNARQARRPDAAWSSSALSVASAPVAGLHHGGKLVRELMRETGLTRAQVRQLAAANAKLADDDRGVEHLATLLLCPSLLSAARDRR